MVVIDEPQFEVVRRSMLRQLGRMSSQNAKGFVIELDYVLEGDAGLADVSIKWRGGDDGLFTAAGQFAGDAASAATRLLAALIDVAYAVDQAIATSSVTDDRVLVSFATWSPGIGVATVRIEAHSRSSPRDLAAH
ncbi:MAG: hypothetical protein WEG56_03530 [Chloroflexota bacterium]